MITEADIRNLESMERSITVAGDDTTIVAADDLGNDYGRNFGNGFGKVSSQDRLVGMGIPEEYAAAAQRGIWAHEKLVHGYDKRVFYNGGFVDIEAVSDADEAEHVRTHRIAMGILSDVDPEAAYAMNFVNWTGSGDVSYFADSTFSGQEGSLKAAEDEGGLINFLRRMYGTVYDSIVGQYKPIDKPFEKVGTYVPNKIKGVVWDAVSGIFGGPTTFMGGIGNGIGKAYHKKAEVALQELSPLIRTLTSSFGVGRTNVCQIYVYNRTPTEKWPIFYTTHDNMTPPTAAELNSEITEVDTHSKSPMKNMPKAELDDAMNGSFVSWNMENYLGGEFNKRYYANEQQRILDWLFREETKSGIWNPDAAAQAALPAGLIGPVSVYRKNASTTGVLPWLGRNIYGDDRPMSPSVAWHCAAGDIGQDIAASTWGIPYAAVLENINIPVEAKRRLMLDVFRYGSKVFEIVGGTGRWLRYD